MTHLRPLILAIALLPLPSIAKDYGPLKPGDKFTLTVKKVSSTKQTGYFGPEEKAKIPGKVPKFKKGRKIRFKVGPKGQLIAKKLRIAYAHGDKKYVEYNSSEDSDGGLTMFTRNAEIAIKRNKPVSGTLSFFYNRYASGTPKIRTVVYELK